MAASGAVVTGGAVVGIGVHGPNAVVEPLEFGYRCAVTELDPGIRRRGGQRIGQRPHPPAREVHACDGVHVGDDGVHRECAVGRNARIERLECEDAVQPRVGDEPLHHPVPPAEAAQRGQPGQRRRQQRQRRVEVRRDEAVEFDFVQPREPVAQPQIALRLLRPG